VPSAVRVIVQHILLNKEKATGIVIINLIAAGKAFEQEEPKSEDRPVS